jgi:hypothetical protein
MDPFHFYVLELTEKEIVMFGCFRNVTKYAWMMGSVGWIGRMGRRFVVLYQRKDVGHGRITQTK